MDSILRDINAIHGVLGSFVCDESGVLLASAIPVSADKDDTDHEYAASSISQIVTGLKSVGMSDVTDVDLRCESGRLVVKTLRPGCLCILCAPHVDLSEVNLTANVAARKLGRITKKLVKENTSLEQTSPTRRQSQVSSSAESTEGILEKVLDLWR